MRLKKINDLPPEMRNGATEYYYAILKKKRVSLFFKRCFDVVVSLFLLALLSPVMLVVAIAIKIDSRGPVFYRQTRVTQYNKTFRIFKFRTMVANADKIGTQVTVNGDPRITRVGRLIRKVMIDELPQLMDVLRGKMTFVGTRPEVPKYTEKYTEEMMATLLLPAGITSEASIYYKDESRLLDASSDPDETYVKEILPVKMYYNLKAIENFGFFHDIKVMFMTVFAVLGKDYRGDYEDNSKKDENGADKQ